MLGGAPLPWTGGQFEGQAQVLHPPRRACYIYIRASLPGGGFGGPSPRGDGHCLIPVISQLHAGDHEKEELLCGWKATWGQGGGGWPRGDPALGLKVAPGYLLHQVREWGGGNFQLSQLCSTTLLSFVMADPCPGMQKQTEATGSIQPLHQEMLSALPPPSFQALLRPLLPTAELCGDAREPPLACSGMCLSALLQTWDRCHCQQGQEVPRRAYQITPLLGGSQNLAACPRPKTPRHSHTRT